MMMRGCSTTMTTHRRCFGTSEAKKKKKVVVTARAFDVTYNALMPHGGLEVVANRGEEPWNYDELLSEASDASAILAFMTDKVDVQLLEACPNLELVACALKGTDNFDLEACRQRNVAVTAVPDLLTAPTAELALLLALGLGRRLREADANVRSGEFRGWRPALYGAGLYGASVGIFGYGKVGRAVSQRVKGFGPARIRYVDPVAPAPVVADENGNGSASTTIVIEAADSLDDLFETCDVLFLCAPLNLETHRAVNADSLSRAKEGLLLVNVSRGSVVDESAVAEALESDNGKLGGYAADVYEFEDWTVEERPRNIDERLLLHPRTLFTPHLGSAVTSTRKQIELAAANEILRWRDGEPLLYRVN